MSRLITGFLCSGGIALLATCLAGAPPPTPWHGSAAVASGGVDTQAPGKRLDRSYGIVVDPGPFITPASAANAEQQIDWNGDDRRSMDACTESFAAQELRHYLCRLARAQEGDPAAFPLLSPKDFRGSPAIVLASLTEPLLHPATALVVEQEKLRQKLVHQESFALVSRGATLFIVGHDRVGALYGAYYLLQTLGVRWYAPGELGEFIPSGATLRMPTHTIIQEPKFLTRGFFAWEDRAGPEFYLWMARSRLNLWTVAAKDRPFLKKLGIRLNAGSHWTFQRYLSPEVYFQSHPEWYGLVDGKRQGFKQEFGVNICTSNAEGVGEMCRNLVADLASGDWRDTDIFELWALDGGKWCECENCKRLGGPTDRLLALVEQVRKALEQAKAGGLIRRDIDVVFPIYLETEPPPTRPLATGLDREHVIGTIFPIGRCYVHCLDDPSCTEYNTKLWAVLQAWKNVRQTYHGQLEIGEYYNLSTTKSLPAVYTHTMAHDIPSYYANGVRHFHYMHVCTRLQGPKRLNNYLMAQLLWDPSIPTDALLSSYFDDFYGTAARPMRRLYDRLEYAMSSVKEWKGFLMPSLVDRINHHQDDLFPSEHLKLQAYHPPSNNGVALEESVASLWECRRIMDSLLVQQWPVLIRQRLVEDDRNLRYAENTVDLYYYVARAIEAKRKGDLAQARECYRATLPLVRGLKEEKEIVESSSSHANAKDGFEASMIVEAYQKLGNELGLSSN